MPTQPTGPPGPPGTARPGPAVAGGGPPGSGGHEIDTLLRRYAVEADRLARAFADRQRMHGTDVQALTVIMDAERTGEPVTPVDLAGTLSMSTGAVSALVDRLERNGHVRRSREASDRRRVHLHHTAEAAQAAGGFFGPLGARAARVRAGFTEDELAVVARFLAAITEEMAEHRRDMNAREQD